MGKGEELTTPWLKAGEAAMYCGMSLSTFNRFAKDIPRIIGGKPKYHAKVLDAFMAGKREWTDGEFQEKIKSDI